MPMRSPPQTLEAVIARVQSVYARWNRHTSIGQMRADWDRFLWTETPGAEVSGLQVGGVAARWIRAEGAGSARVLLYFHGGGYKMGSVVSHHELMVRLSAAADCRVLGIDYRLMPEHRFPAPVEDAGAAYRGLLEHGVPGENIALAGDSAGAGLVAACMLAVRDQALPRPAAGVMLSALTDFAATGASYDTRAACDPFHHRALIQALARQYLGELDPRDPRASPLYADLHGLPPLLLQVGDRETGLDDSVRFAERARAAGVSVELTVWDGMIHVFQQFPELEEAQAAIQAIGTFLQSNWSKS